MKRASEITAWLFGLYEFVSWQPERKTQSDRDLGDRHLGIGVHAENRPQIQWQLADRTIDCLANLISPSQRFGEGVGDTML